MIYPRLKLAKDLLTDDGIILINIDENEMVNLQKACSEVYGIQNDLGTIVWDKRNPKGDARGVSQQHEYIVLYAKNKEVFFTSCSMQRPKANAQAILKKAKALFSRRSATYITSGWLRKSRSRASISTISAEQTIISIWRVSLYRPTSLQRRAWSMKSSRGAGKPSEKFNFSAKRMISLLSPKIWSNIGGIASTT